jgi:hypothetical protein
MEAEMGRAQMSAASAARIVEVGEKAVTAREATAECVLSTTPDAVGHNASRNPFSSHVRQSYSLLLTATAASGVTAALTIASGRAALTVLRSRATSAVSCDCLKRRHWSGSSLGYANGSIASTASRPGDYRP